jgi:hypothetical protein
MNKAMGRIISFLVGGGLGFAVVTVLLSLDHNEGIRQYALVAGIVCGLPAGCFVGLVEGAVIGAVVDRSDKK